MDREQIIKALECCGSDVYVCQQCPIDEKIKDDCECGKLVTRNALALITSQEQRIGAQDMTISELRKRVEKAEHDADRYAQRIKELTEEKSKVFEKGAENLTRLEEAYLKLEAENLKLTEENARLRAETIEEYRQKVNTKMGKHTHLLGKEYVQRILREVKKEMVGDKDV